MADGKKYYYMRLREDFFDSEELKIMESMPDGYLYSNILLKLYLLSLKDNGKLCFKGVIPYSPEMIATLTGHQVGTVKQALQIFRNMKLVEILDDGVIYMLNIQNFIGKASSEADRIREYERRIAKEREEAKLVAGGVSECKKSTKKSTKISTEKSTPEIRDKRLEIRDYINPPYIPPEGENKPEKKDPDPLEDLSGSEELRKAVSDWLAYKREMRKAYKPTGLKAFISSVNRKAAEFGEVAVIDLIADSMANGYQGVTWDRLRKRQEQQRPAYQPKKTGWQVLQDLMAEEQTKEQTQDFDFLEVDSND